MITITWLDELMSNEKQDPSQSSGNRRDHGMAAKASGCVDVHPVIILLILRTMSLRAPTAWERSTLALGGEIGR